MELHSVVALLVIATGGLLLGTSSAFNPHLNELDSVDEFDAITLSTKLDPKNFERQLNSSHYNLVLFYAPWCEYCLNMLPEWTDLADMVNERFAGSIQVGHMDCIAEEVLCSRLDIEDYPSVRVYARGPPRRFESVQPYELVDTVEYLQEYVFNPPEDSSYGVV